MQTALARSPAPDALELHEKAARHPRGRHELLTELYRAHAARVLRWIVRMGGWRIDAEDTLHEVFCAIHEQLNRFEGRGQITTWLFAITRNIVCERMERETRRQRLLGRHAEELPRHYLPFEEFEQRHSLALVCRILGALPEKYRRAFTMLELAGMTAEEAGALTGIKKTTLRVQRMRARTMFMARLAALRAATGTEEAS